MFTRVSRNLCRFGKFNNIRCSYCVKDISRLPPGTPDALFFCNANALFSHAWFHKVRITKEQDKSIVSKYFRLEFRVNLSESSQYILKIWYYLTMYSCTDLRTQILVTVEWDSWMTMFWNVKASKVSIRQYYIVATHYGGWIECLQ